MKPSLRSERGISASRTVRAAAATVFTFIYLAPSILRANPGEGQVVAGGATIDQAGSSLTVNQSTDKVIINWQSFSIANGELTKFVQPSATSAALNRVVGDNISSIYGNLQSNGQIFLINGNGIVVGATGVINTGGFTASTQDLANEEFLNSSSLHFNGTSDAAITNLGSISATGGNVFLIANTIENKGNIHAALGTAGLASGHDILLTEGVEKLLVRPALPGQANSTVSNSGSIESASAELKAAAGNIYALAIKNEGTIRATGSAEVNGRIWLKAPGSSSLNTGTIEAAGGRIEAEAQSVVNAGLLSVASVENAGSVEIHSSQAANLGVIDATSQNGKGGSLSIQATDSYFDTASSRLKADGKTEGGVIEALLANENSLLYSSGRWSARASEGQGGQISASAANTYIMGSNYDVSGRDGGGRLLVGGDWQGSGSMLKSQNTVINPTAELKADALGSGDGGTVVVWSEGTTSFYGNVSAKAGSEGGNGGKMEISGLGGILYSGVADAGSAHGQNGLLLLDPKDIIIDDSAAGSGIFAFEFLEPAGFNVNGAFGQTLIAEHGNVLITNPLNDTVATDSGAVYLFDASNGTLLSTLLGSSAQDRVGSGGVQLVYGADEQARFLIHSPDWGVGDEGALTWMNYDGLLSTGSGGGTVGMLNSLLGQSAGDLISFSLSNADMGRVFITTSNWGGGKGAVTWMEAGSGALSDASTGGIISATNSLVGSSGGDYVGSNGITGLGFFSATSTSVYAVLSPHWNGDEGAVTWIDGNNGKVYNAGSGFFDTNGASVSTNNSFIGANAGDQVGYSSMNGGSGTILNFSNLILLSTSEFDSFGVNGNGAGALTLIDMNAPSLPTGTLGFSNSLVGAQSGDSIGSSGVEKIGDALVILSPFFDNGPTIDVGAITFLDTTSAGFLTGFVNTTNSLIGSGANDLVGLNHTFSYSSGLNEYVLAIVSSYWSSDTGAVTLVRENTGTSLAGQVVSSSNSWMGSASGDKIGNGGFIALDGGLLVMSPEWGGTKGAATFIDWTSSPLVVDGTTSLTGSNSGDYVGANYYYEQLQGDALIFSPDFDGAKGAITWVSKNGLLSTGVSMAGQNVTALNSLLGLSSGDMAGLSVNFIDDSAGQFIVFLNPLADNGAISNAGAVTWMQAGSGLLYDGATFSVTGSTIDSVNSLVGSQAGDKVGSGGLLSLSNGDWIVSSPDWDNGGLADAGALTWSDGSIVAGAVGALNSLVGDHSGDKIGSGGVHGFNNWLVIVSPEWNGTRGQVNMIDKAVDGTVGLISPIGKSISGSTVGDKVGSGGVSFSFLNFGGVVLSPFWNGNRGAATYFSDTIPLPDAAVTSSNSLVGNSAGDKLGSGGAFFYYGGGNGDYFVISSPQWNGNQGAATWLAGDDAGSLSGVVDLSAGYYNIFGGMANSGMQSYIPADFYNNAGTFFVTFSGDTTGGRAGHVRAGFGAGPVGGGGFLFANNPSGTLALTSTQITAITNTGTDIILQANNDITLMAGTNIISNNTSGDGGNITLQAGRSILLNGQIFTDNGDLILIANESAANGVFDAHRDMGQSVVTATQELNTGTGLLSITMLLGDDKTNYETGAITLGMIRAGSMQINHDGLSGTTTGGAASINETILDGDTDVTGSLSVTGYDIKVKKLIEAGSMSADTGHFYYQYDLGDVHLTGGDFSLIGAGVGLFGGGATGDGKTDIHVMGGAIDIQVGSTLNGNISLKTTGGEDISLSGINGGWTLFAEAGGTGNINLNGTVGGGSMPLASMELNGHDIYAYNNISADVIDWTAANEIYLNNVVMDTTSYTGPAQYGILLDAAKFTFAGTDILTAGTNQGIAIRSTLNDVDASTVALTAGSLVFEGPGNFIFNNINNQFDVVATGNAEVGGDITLFDTDGFTIGQLPSADESDPPGTTYEDLRAAGNITLTSGGNIIAQHEVVAGNGIIFNILAGNYLDIQSQIDAGSGGVQFNAFGTATVKLGADISTDSGEVAFNSNTVVVLSAASNSIKSINTNADSSGGADISFNGSLNTTDGTQNLVLNSGPNGWIAFYAAGQNVAMNSVTVEQAYTVQLFSNFTGKKLLIEDIASFSHLGGTLNLISGTGTVLDVTSDYFTLNSTINATGKNVRFNSSANNGITNVSGLVLNADGLLLESAGPGDFNMGTVTINTLAAQVNGDLDLTSPSLTIGTVGAVSGVKSSGGDINLTTSSGDLIVQNTVESKYSVNLTSSGNLLFSGGNLKALDASLIATGALTAGSSNISNTLSLSRSVALAGDITQNGSISVGTLEATNNLGNIILNNPGNKIIYLGSVSASAGSVDIFEDPGMTVNAPVYALGDITIGSYGGNLTIASSITSSSGIITLYTNFGNDVDMTSGSLSAVNYVVYSTTDDFLGSLTFDTTIHAPFYPAAGIASGENTLVLLTPANLTSLDEVDTEPYLQNPNQNGIVTVEDDDGNMEGGGVILTAYGEEGDGNYVDNTDGFVGLDNFGNRLQITDPRIIILLKEALGDTSRDDLLAAIGISKEEFAAAAGGTLVTPGEFFDMSDFSSGSLASAPKVLQDALSDKAKAELEAILGEILESNGSLEGIFVTVGQVVDMDGVPLPSMPPVLVIALSEEARLALEKAMQ